METERVSALMGQTIIPPKAPVKYLLYARKSTESEERQVLNIDSQVKEMMEMAEGKI